MGGGVGSLRCALENSPWVTPKTPILIMKRDRLRVQGWQKAVLKSSPVLGGGVGGQCPGSLHEGSTLWGHWNPVGFSPTCPQAPDWPGAQRPFTGHSPACVVPRWAALCEFSCFPLLFCFPFLLFPSYSSCFPSPQRLFFFLFLIILIFPPYFVVILYIPFTLKSGPCRTPVLQLMILKRIFWCINFS